MLFNTFKIKYVLFVCIFLNIKNFKSIKSIKSIDLIRKIKIIHNVPSKLHENSTHYSLHCI